MKYLPLSNSERKVTVDDDIFELVKDRKWRVITVTNGAQYIAWRTHRQGKDVTVYLHRLVMENPKGRMVDHIDGGIYNCQRSNLRVATNSQNQMNSKKRLGAKSFYKGVCWNKQRGLWKAHIRKDGKNYHLGYFYNPRHAAYAYDFAAKDLFGDFARLNFTA